MGFFTPKQFATDEPEAAHLTEESLHLQQKLAELEGFVESAPELAQQEFDEHYSTMPPPDELEDRRRERLFHEKLCRNELRNERRYQAQSGFMIVLLIACAISLAAWAIKISQAGL